MITHFTSTYSTPDEDDRPCEVEIVDEVLGRTLVVIDEQLGNSFDAAELDVREQDRLFFEAERVIEADEFDIAYTQAEHRALSA